MFEIKAHCESSCDNKGFGFWSFNVILEDGRSDIIGGQVEKTTANELDMLSILKTLEWCNSNIYESSHIKIFTTLKYISDAVNNDWISNWKKNGWKTSDRKDVKHKEAWEKLDEFLKVKKNKVEIIFQPRKRVGEQRKLEKIVRRSRKIYRK
jgi:ribonuclease HI